MAEEALSRLGVEACLLYACAWCWAISIIHIREEYSQAKQRKSIPLMEGTYRYNGALSASAPGFPWSIQGAQRHLHGEGKRGGPDLPDEVPILEGAKKKCK